VIGEPQVAPQPDDRDVVRGVILRLTLREARVAPRRAGRGTVPAEALARAPHARRARASARPHVHDRAQLGIDRAQHRLPPASRRTRRARRVGAVRTVRRERGERARVLRRAPARGDDPYALDALLAGLPPPQRCGLDVALHDLHRQGRRPAAVAPARPRSRAHAVTSFTIGIDTPRNARESSTTIRDHPIVKGQARHGRDRRRSRRCARATPGTMRVDANEAWTPESKPSRSSRRTRALRDRVLRTADPGGTPERLRWIRERSRVPIVTDEDSKDARDLPALAGCVDGINVKLVKCGGIRGALAMIHTARALGLKIMLGCMVESAILTTAAAHLSPLVDWADLDGPFLVARDPFAASRTSAGRSCCRMARASASSSASPPPHSHRHDERAATRSSRPGSSRRAARRRRTA
jgi:hypothetical protein